MAKEPDNAVYSLLREISAKQDEQSRKLDEQSKVLADHTRSFDEQARTLEDHTGKLGVLDNVIVQVVGMSADIREMKADIKGIKGELEVIHSDSHDGRVEMHAMSKDLRELRADTNEVRRVVAGHTLRFDFLDERFEVLRKGTLTAVSAAASANESARDINSQVVDLTRRVEKLEKAK
jgi:chromosome segregation ATPase